MHLKACLLVVAALAFANCQRVEHHEEQHQEKQRTGPLGRKSEVEQHSEKHQGRSEMRREVGKKSQSESRHGSKLSESTKEELVVEKQPRVMYEKEIQSFLKNPNTNAARECFNNYLKPGLSVDFVIDIAPSPSRDKEDRTAAESPIGLFYEKTFTSGSKTYFNAIQLFIDVVTIDMKPQSTHSIIFEKGRKFYIRGRNIDDVEAVDQLKSRGEFKDESRNLKTLWPICTKEGFSVFEPIVKNNLGRLTELALWNRDNGLPTVLSSTRRSKPVYTVVISDGSSGAKIDDLVDDLTRTTVIDIGNRRFVNNMSWDEIRRVAGVYTLTAPKQLMLLIDSVRNMVCLSSEHASKNM